MFRPRPRRERDAASGRARSSKFREFSRTRGRSISPRSFCNGFSRRASYMYTHPCIGMYRSIPFSVNSAIDKHLVHARARARVRACVRHRTEFLISLFAFSHARLVHACMRSRCINVENRICSATVGMRRIQLSREICIGEKGEELKGEDWLAIYVKQRSRNAMHVGTTDAQIYAYKQCKFDRMNKRMR